MNDLFIYNPRQKPERHTPLWVLVTTIVLVVALLVASACYLLLAPEPATEPEQPLVRSSATFSNHFYGITLDITNMDIAQIESSLLICALKGYDSVAITTGSISDTESISYAIQSAHNQGLSPYFLFDISAADSGFTGTGDMQKVGAHLRSICSTGELTGIYLCGWDVYLPADTPVLDFSVFYNMEDLCKIIRYTDPSLFIGLYCEGDVADNSLAISWLKRAMFDTVMIDCGGYLTNGHGSFETNVAAWEEAVSEYCETVYMLRASRINTTYSGWNDPSQLLWQAVALTDEHGLQFCLDSFTTVANDTSDSTPRLHDFLKSLSDNNYIIKDLIFTSPAAQNSSTYSSVIVFAGASDPSQPLLMNGKEIQRDKLGHFEELVEMQPGMNKIVFIHNSREYTFSINYIQATLALVYPNSTQYYDSGSTISLTAVAKKGSKVTATIGNKTVTLKQESFYEESVDTFGEYYTFIGSITLPVLSADTDMGKVKFTAELGTETHTKEGGTIAVYRKKVTQSTPQFTLPESSGYQNVGNEYIAEVIVDRAETFSGSKLNDYSQPTNSYLPKGTVDYCKGTSDTLFNSDGEKLNYRTLRYGKRVYVSSDRNGQEIKVYKGELPDTNNVSLAYLNESTRNTTMAFTVDWKAPFKFETAGQKYIDDDTGDDRPYFTVDSVNYTYVDITFCYAATAQGNISISSSNPVFSWAEWIKNEADWTLRLHLRKAGSLYGWSCEYDDSGRLVFSFLHPAKLTSADNIYGVSLQNVVVLLDPGHTGTAESGATHNLYGKNQKYNVTEAMANLTLSLEIKRQLEALGATVYLTRTHNNLSSTLSLNERIKMIDEIKPDIFISVHHNYNKYASPEGFSSYYFTPISWRLSNKIYNATNATALYREMRGNMWHTYYITRVTDCPAILTENGYISNDYEYQNIITDPSANQQRAAATVKGIVDYFKSIQ